MVNRCGGPRTGIHIEIIGRKVDIVLKLFFLSNISREISYFQDRTLDDSEAFPCFSHSCCSALHAAEFPILKPTKKKTHMICSMILGDVRRNRLDT